MRNSGKRKYQNHVICMKKTSLTLVSQFILRKHHLSHDSRIDDVVQIAGDTCGLHATYPPTPYLSLFARTRSFEKEQLDQALYVKKRLGKIRCMRGTIHVLTKEFIPIAFAATRRMLQKGSEDFLEYRGISMKEYREVSESVLTLLKDKEMTSSEIREALGTQLNIPAVVEQMCDQGLLIRGRPRKGWKDRVNRFLLFHDYFPDIDLTKMAESEARALLVQSYLSSFGPATEKDIAWWIGLTMTEVREALSHIEEQVTQVDVSDAKGNFIMLRSDEEPLGNVKASGRRTVNLLPTLDPYLMGYKDRVRYLSQKHQEYVFDRGGNATTTILVDGRIVGVWDYIEDVKPLVKLFLLEGVERTVLSEIHLEARKIGRFIAEQEVQTKECDSMLPLTRRTAGGFMSPLKDL